MTEQYEPPAPIPEPVAEAVAAPLEADVSCKRCGYNLRGLLPTGRCPECATPIGFSMQGYRLRFSDPQWIEKLALGTRLILWGMLIVVVVSIIGSVLLRYAIFFRQMLGIAASLVGLWGAWLLTEPDPSGLDEDPGITARKLVRAALIAGLAGQLVEVSATHILIGTKLLHFLSAVLVALLGFIGVVGEIARLSYLERLARRIPNLVLANRAHFLRNYYGVALSIVTVLGSVFIFATILLGPAAMRPSRTGTSAWLGVVGCGGIIFGLALLVFMIMVIVLLFRLGRSFRTEAAYARATWMLTDSPAVS